ncbi:MAG: hypothetical protein GX643_10325 [Acidimicrobiales bacterium]|nr:hypothetical protein [Acidimicrobiales bacterium]
MFTHKRHRRLAGVLTALVLLTAACGSDDDDNAASDTPEAGATENGGADEVCETAQDEDDSVESLADLDFSGISVNVGSKDFVEQFVLGNLLIVGLEAGGASVTDSTNLGGTLVNREALLAGEIDAYFDYNGTGWTNFLEQDDPSFDSEELTNDVCVGDLAENDVRWLGVSPFNNTYGFATAGDSDAAGGDLQAMADYVTENEDATVCLETEFPNRPDGMVLFEEATGVVIPDAQTQILETGVIYEETASGNCTFGEIFTTDGRIPALGLDVVDDPGVFILYNVSLTMKDGLYQEAPEEFEAIADTLLNILDADTMAELNRQVSADGKDPKVVATEFLTAQGLI